MNYDESRYKAVSVYDTEQKVFTIIYNNFEHHERAYLTYTTLTHTYTQYNINTYTNASNSPLLIGVPITFHDCQAYTSFCKSHSPLAASGIYKDLKLRLMVIGFWNARGKYQRV